MSCKEMALIIFCWKAFTLLKSVLTSIPIYTLASAVVPKGIVRRIEHIMAQFLWSVNGENQFHWVSWTMVCLAIDEGGLGVRRFEVIQ